MGKKYIIELDDKPFHKEDGDFLYRVKGFNSLVFDMTGIDKLIPYTEPDLEQVKADWYKAGREAEKVRQPDLEQVRKEAYQQGLSDAKEGKATCQYCEYQYLDDTEEPCKKCCNAYMNKYKPKAKEEQIKVGDEIKGGNDRYIVLQTYLNNIDEPMAVLFNKRDGDISQWHLYNVNGKMFEKTGRHVPEIAAVLRKMKESDNG